MTLVSPLRLFLLAPLLALLAGCAGTLPATACAPCETCRKCVEPSVTPAAPALQRAAWEDLPGWGDDDHAAAWPVFLRSCKALKVRRVWAEWQAICEAAESVRATDSEVIRSFWESHLVPWALTQPDGTRDGLITGYYEPILKGDRKRTERARYPVRSVPDDLLVIDLGELYPELKSYRLRGRIDGKRVVPYRSRALLREEDARGESLAEAKVLAWVEDPVELFFLHIQGAGRIVLPDGAAIRVGFADQNGHPYKSAGKVLIERGELRADQASMQGIQEWARANPDKLDAVLDANPSYVFFRRLPDNQDGPPGALGVPLQAERSLAVDPRTIPLGAPVYLATTQPLSAQPLNRLMLAQDTGGAIKGVVRADYFWGLGPAAGQSAGRMKQKGRMWVLLPRARRDGPDSTVPDVPK